MWISWSFGSESAVTILSLPFNQFIRLCSSIRQLLFRFDYQFIFLIEFFMDFLGFTPVFVNSFNFLVNSVEIHRYFILFLWGFLAIYAFITLFVSLFLLCFLFNQPLRRASAYIQPSFSVFYIIFMFFFIYPWPISLHKKIPR
jgi:hypothetical protein